MARRTPRNASKPSGGCAFLLAWRSTSSRVIKPWSPVPDSVFKSTFNFFASMRTAGVLFARAEFVCAEPTTKLSSLISVLSSKLPTTVPLSTRGCASASKATSGSPVLITSPGLPYNLTMVPLWGQGTSTTAFAVSMDAKG